MSGVGTSDVCASGVYTSAIRVYNMHLASFHRKPGNIRCACLSIAPTKCSFVFHQLDKVILTFDFVDEHSERFVASKQSVPPHQPKEILVVC